jgi:hypothetical protein
MLVSSVGELKPEEQPAEKGPTTRGEVGKGILLVLLTGRAHGENTFYEATAGLTSSAIQVMLYRKYVAKSSVVSVYCRLMFARQHYLDTTTHGLVLGHISLYTRSRVMTSRTFAVIAGMLYVGAGLLGFLPGVTQPVHGDAPHLAVSAGYSYLFGLFPINVLHNLVHLGVGAWGLLSSRAATAARSFARGVAILYGALAVMGLFPGLNTTFGLIPIFGHDIWLHAGTAVVAAYFGWALPAEVAEPRVRRREGNVHVWDTKSDSRPHA